MKSGSRAMMAETLLQCPSCRGTFSRSGDELRCNECSSSARVEGRNIVFSPAAEASREWQSQQDDSVARYQHESYEEDDRIGRLFGAFAAVTMDRNEPVLDVGCGLDPSLPHYVKELRLKDYIGLEPLSTAVPRSYDCLVGAVAERLPLRDATIGSALFATSLDHIEHVEVAIAEVLRVLRPDGRLFFWVGVHDPQLLAEAKTFGSIVNRGSLPFRMARIAAAYAEYGYLLSRMWKRKRDLAEGRPLDSAHWRYYTLENLDQEMRDLGLEVERRIVVPGTNSVFLDAVARAAASS